ncbi:hypothetical protein MIR68_001218 [Amoeboaphelidium protococcarum]|nr:hypothetical protein MIR68_001218 [Amoeboaphelidium protococcarum]
MEVEDVDQNSRAQLEQAICVEDITQDVQTKAVDSVKPQNGFKLFRRSNPTAAVKIDQPDYDTNGSAQAHKALPRFYLQEESSDEQQSRITQFSSIVMDSERIMQESRLYYLCKPAKEIMLIKNGILQRQDINNLPAKKSKTHRGRRKSRRYELAKQQQRAFAGRWKQDYKAKQSAQRRPAFPNRRAGEVKPSNGKPYIQRNKQAPFRTQQSKR